MKKLLLFLSLGIFALSCDAQNTYPWSSTGNVGIGNNDPRGTLHVNGTFLIKGANIDYRFPAGIDLSYLQNSGQMLIGWNRSAGGGETDFISNQGGGSTGGFGFYNYSNDGVLGQLMTINANGSVGIGTATTSGYQLAVKGGVVAGSVKVQLMDTWPDYVFKPDYRLPSLPELKTYIDQHSHLPDMPSASEVAKEGIDLADMNARLLKKVEELTLYLIEQNKQIKELQNKVATIKQ